MNEDWCCGLLEGLVDNASKAGLAVFARSDPRGSVFVLQMRATPIDVPPPDGTVVEEVVVRFCPGCGAELVPRYRASLHRFLRDDLTIHTEL